MYKNGDSGPALLAGPLFEEFRHKYKKIIEKSISRLFIMSLYVDLSCFNEGVS